jgi:hypothetical protein
VQEWKDELGAALAPNVPACRLPTHLSSIAPAARARLPPGPYTATAHPSSTPTNAALGYSAWLHTTSASWAQGHLRYRPAVPAPYPREGAIKDCHLTPAKPTKNSRGRKTCATTHSNETCMQKWVTPLTPPQIALNKLLSHYQAPASKHLYSARNAVRRSLLRPRAQQCCTALTSHTASHHTTLATLACGSDRK